MQKRTKLVWLVLTVLVGIELWALSAVFAGKAESKTTSRFEETDAVLANPFMGFSVDARGKGGQQPYTLAHANIFWKDLEPVKGRFEFEAFEREIQLARWKQEGVRLVLRVILDYPGDESHRDIPEWLYEEMDGKGSWYDVDYGRGFSPDYSHPALISNHARLIEALGERYNDNPDIAFIQLGSIGHWGEWHTWDQSGDKIPFPTRKVTDQYVLPYVESFPDKPLLARRPLAIAKKYGFGLFNDAFGNKESTVEEFYKWYTKGYVSWLTKEQEPSMLNFWVNAPSGGEFADGDRYFTDSSIKETIRQARLTHLSWIGPRGPAEEKRGGPLQMNIDRFLATIGYRYVISEASYASGISPGESLTVDLRVLNRGIAPFYFEWPFQLSLINEEGVTVSRYTTKIDIRKWLPGTAEEQADYPIPKGIAPGDYTLAAAIVDPDTGRPGVQFAMDNRRADGRYPLGTLTIR